MFEQINIEKLKFPVGDFKTPSIYSTESTEQYIKTISDFPQKLTVELSKTSFEILNWQYRPNGWTIKQVVHHCADSHINAFIRLKLALTESHPSISPYEEHLWANLIDGQDDDLSFSLKILEGIHYKWSKLLQSLSNNDLQRTYYHPANQTVFTVQHFIALYAWHCNHHLAHIKQGIESNGKFNK